jgi:4-hydroxy-2-oxoheptanedioate aldolase
MRLNPLKARLAAGQPCRGIWLALASPNSARLVARLPIDWVVVDAEHTPMDEVTLYRMVTGIAEAAGPAPVVRVAQLTVENLKHALDAGAYGVIAPMVNTRAEAEQAVAWSRFPPQGVRSYGSPYVAMAFDTSMKEYLRQANEQVLVGVQIESAAALANLDAIFSTPGLDLGFVGPVDLSISLGLEALVENPHPLFQDAISRVLQAGAVHHLPLGIFCSKGKAAAERIRQGFQFVNVTTDTFLLQDGLKAELDASMI